MDEKNPFQPFGQKGFWGLLSARVAKLNDIRRGLADSTLVNTDAHTRHLEGAYREVVVQSSAISAGT